MNLSEITDRLAYFKELYRKSLDKQSALYDRLERNRAQYKGSRAIDNSSVSASVVRNITYELIESQVSTLIPTPAAEAKQYTEQNDRCAKAIEYLCASLRRELPFEKLNDMDERYTYIYGGSVWFVEWDASLVKSGAHGGVRLTCLSPLDFIPEPGVYDVEDMEYCFLRFDTSPADIARRYGVPLSKLTELAETGDDPDTVELVLAFWRNDEGYVCAFAFSGDAILFDVEDYYARKGEKCRVCGRSRALCACEHPRLVTASEENEYLTEEIALSDGRILPALSPVVGEDGALLGERLAPTALPFYRPRRFPIVIRKNTSEEKSLYGQSDCEFIRPQQQQINKIESRILEKLMRSGVTPILPDDAEMTLDNSIFGQIIKLRTGDEKERYGILDTTPSIAQDITQSDRLYEHAKRILGITDSYLGIGDTSAQSGYAKQVQVEQAAGRLESKRKMKQTAYAELDRILFEYHLAYADESRPISYKDAFGKQKNAIFNRYDFIVYRPETGKYEYNDDFLFSVDLGGGVEQRREELWKRNLENLTAGTLGDPSDPATLLHYWLSQERAHYPYAKENVEYFRARIKEQEEKGEEYGEAQKFYRELSQKSKNIRL